MKKRINKIVLLNILTLSICFLLFFFSKKNSVITNKKYLLNGLDKQYEVKEVLNIEAEEYKNLPEEVKEYIVDEYENTGKVILTEENKIENESYLNPEYIKYLTLNEEEQERYAAAPPELINDYVGDVTDNYSSTYNLTNVNNVDYTNALKDQENLGLCWSFSSIASMETKIAKKYGVASKVVFSERQIDYVTSIPTTAKAYNGEYKTAVTEQYNPYNVGRTLGGGGNFSDASYAIIYGVSPILSSTFAYENKTYNSKSLATIFDSGDSYDTYVATKSEKRSGINMYNLSKKTDKTEYNNVINYIKDRLMTNGSMYVATLAPQTSSSGVCYNSNLKLINFIGNSQEACPGYTSYGTHAMSIIGWDDDYNYSYCIKNSSITSDNEVTCTGTWITGTGVWILRNSWGEGPTSYPKLAYSSYFMELGQYTDVEPMTSDNTYDDRMLPNEFFKTFRGGKSLKILKNDSDEILDRIVFNTNSANNYYNVYISKTGLEKDYELIEENIYKEYPGMVSINPENITLSKDSFLIKITSLSNITNIDSVVAYTSDVVTSPTKKATTHDISKTFISNVQNNSVEYLITNTKNISSGETLNYVITSSSGAVTPFEIADSYIINGKYITTIVLEHATVSEVYNVKTYLSDGTLLDDSASITINVSEAIQLTGQGTELSPYQITSPRDFAYIEDKPGAYYELANNIDFKNYAHIPVGNEDIPFSGHFDGNGYTIANLTIAEGNEKIGLFGRTYEAQITDINFENVALAGNSYIGTLAGFSIGTAFNNITIKSGTIEGYVMIGGMIGQAQSSTITNVTNKANVIGEVIIGGIVGGTIDSNILKSSNYGKITGLESVGGIVGMLYNYQATSSSITESFNVGNILSTNGTNIAGIAGTIYGKCNISYVFNTGNIIGLQNTAGLLVVASSSGSTLDNAYNLGNALADVASEDNSTLTISNIYYSIGLGTLSQNATNKSLIDKNEFHNLTTLTYLNNTKWHINNNTYPSLINNDYYFISNITIGDTNVQLGTLELPVITFSPLNVSNPIFTYSSMNEEIFTIDNSDNIVCNKVGTAKLKIDALDGSNFSKEILINCINEMTGVSLISNPSKTTYYIGDNLDITGGLLKITYQNGDTLNVDITSDMISGFDSTESNDSLQLTITYLEHLFNYNIKIIPYVIDIEKTDDEVRLIPLSKTHKEFNRTEIIKRLELSLTYKILDSNAVELTDVEFLGTGMKIVDTNTYTVIIRGEITGDGKINQGDVSKLYNYYRGKVDITGPYLLAARIRGSETINQGDVSKLYNYYRGNIESLEG